jgi:hypothetical protein
VPRGSTDADARERRFGATPTRRGNRTPEL